jgi:hypothetical protein
MQGDIFIWDVPNLLLLIPVVIGLVTTGALVSGKGGVHGAGLTPALWTSAPSRRSRGLMAPVRRVAPSRGDDWVRPRSPRLPYGLGWFVGALILTAAEKQEQNR